LKIDSEKLEKNNR